MSKFSWEKVPLTSLECEILLFLKKEDMPLNQETIRKKTKTTISAVSKAITRLYDKRLIYKIKDSINFYGINPYRLDEVKRFLTGYELGKNKDIVLSGHAFVYEAEINDLTEQLAKRLGKNEAFISFRPNGWKYAYKMSLPDGSYKLQKTPSGAKLIAYFRTFGFDARIIEQINNEKFLDLKSELENVYVGLKIGKPEMISACPWQEYAIQKDYVAVEGIKRGIKHKKIEQSYHYPEWEEKGFNAVDKINKIISLREKEIVDLEPPQLKEEIDNKNDKVVTEKEQITDKTIEET